MKKYFLLFVAITFILIFVFVFCMVYVPSYEYDNTPINYNSNQEYSADKINKLEKSILTYNITLKEFLIKYKPQYIRKTFQGFYAVLTQDNGSLCFVFWDFEDNIHSVYRTEKFVSSSEFEQKIKVGETTVESLTSSGLDFFYFPISKVMMTGHICTDGVIVVQYNNSIVEFKSFFSNQELTTIDESTIDMIPYILEIDKQ